MSNVRAKFVFSPITFCFLVENPYGLDGRTDGHRTIGQDPQYGLLQKPVTKHKLTVYINGVSLSIGEGSDRSVSIPSCITDQKCISEYACKQLQIRCRNAQYNATNFAVQKKIRSSVLFVDWKCLIDSRCKPGFPNKCRPTDLEGFATRRDFSRIVIHLPSVT